MARICSIAPEMLYPEDQPRVLCSIMDWGTPNWGWLVCVDYGQFSDAVGFGVLVEDEYRALTNEPNEKWQHTDWFDDLPSFAGSQAVKRRCDTEPATFGDWVNQAVKIILATE